MGFAALYPSYAFKAKARRRQAIALFAFLTTFAA
jgi:hypothetical protein